MIINASFPPAIVTNSKCHKSIKPTAILWYFTSEERAQFCCGMFLWSRPGPSFGQFQLTRPGQVEPWYCVTVVQCDILKLRNDNTMSSGYWPLERQGKSRWLPEQWAEQPSHLVLGVVSTDWRYLPVSFLQGWWCLYSPARWRAEMYNFHILSEEQKTEIFGWRVTTGISITQHYHITSTVFLRFRRRAYSVLNISHDENLIIRHGMNI